MGGNRDESPVQSKEPVMIKVEDAFSNHLEMMKLNPAKMTPHTLKELKKAFYAGFAHLIAIQNYVVSKHSQEEASKMLDQVSKQIDDYLIEATGRNVKERN